MAKERVDRDQGRKHRKSNRSPAAPVQSTRCEPLRAPRGHVGGTAGQHSASRAAGMLPLDRESIELCKEFKRLSPHFRQVVEQWEARASDKNWIRAIFARLREGSVGSVNFRSGLRREIVKTGRLVEALRAQKYKFRSYSTENLLLFPLDPALNHLALAQFEGTERNLAHWVSRLEEQLDRGKGPATDPVYSSDLCELDPVASELGITQSSRLRPSSRSV